MGRERARESFSLCVRALISLMKRSYFVMSHAQFMHEVVVVL